MRSTISELQAFANATYGGQLSLLTPYSYSIDFGTIGAGATVYQQLQIQANADFILTSFGGLYDIGGLSYNYPLKCLITDNSSGEQFTNAPIHVGTYIVNPALDANSVLASDSELPYPLFIQGRTSLTIMIQNLAGGADFVLQLNGVLARKYSRV